MGAPIKYPVGTKFNYWTLLQRLPKRGTAVYWRCICDCGVIKEVSMSTVVGGQSKSCRDCSIERRWQKV